MPKKHESSSKEIEIMRKFKEGLQTPYLELAIKKEDHKKNKKNQDKN